MIRCKTCVMPATRPDTPFVDGECSACRSFARRPQIDWPARKAALLQLLDRHGARVMVPSSGGKDSTYIALTLKELGADVTAITARTCHLTRMGRANIDSLARHVRTIEFTPNMEVRAKLNRLALERVGDISWPEHASIFSTPFRVARDTGHTLLMYGENPQTEYGGPPGTDEAMTMTRRWVSEFGGFLGLRPRDFVGIEGITERDMADYQMPADVGQIEAHFLGQYLPWDAHQNAEVAIASGFQYTLPASANWWPWENLDNGQTGLHDWFMKLKYDFGRGAQQISMDVRHGRCSREHAMTWLATHENVFPTRYAEVHVQDVLQRIGMTPDDLRACENKFRSRA
jgi:hypothetical protein